MADEKSRLAEIYKAEKSKGGGIAITLGKRALEKLDPRQFFNQKGLMAAALPSLFKSYSATPAKSGGKIASLGSGSLSSNALETKLDVLIGETKDVKINSKLSAKNSMVLPDIARDMNVMRQNIQKLVKLQGGTAAKGTDMYFKKAGEREASYESQFGKEKFKTSPTLVGAKPEEKKEGGILGFLSTLFSPLLTLGATIASAITGTLATLFSPNNLVKVFGLGLDVIKGIGTAFRVLLPLLTNPVFLSIVGGLLAAKWLMDLIDKKNSEANTPQKMNERVGDDRGSQSSKVAARTIRIDEGLKSLLKDDRTDEEVSAYTRGEIRTKDELRAKIAEAEALGKRAIEIKDSRVVEEARQERNKIADRMDAEIGAPEPPPLPRFSTAADSQAANTPTPTPTPAPQPPTTSPTRSSITPITTGPGGAAFGMYPKPGGIQSDLMAAFAQEGITDEKTQIALLANIKKESGFTPISENLNYTSTARLKEVFPTRTKNLSDEQLKQYTNNPQGLAELVYGGKMGNTEPGDGFKYRGRGFIQLTGKNNYASMGKALNIPLVDNPDLANDPVVAARIAARYIKDANLRKSFNTQEEANRAVTQSIGGSNLNLNSGYGASLLSKVNSYAGDISLASSASTSSPNQSAGLAPNAPSSGITLSAATTDVSKEKMILASAAPVVNNVTNNNVNNTTTAGGQSQGNLPSVYDDVFLNLFQRVS
jgi:predicted chitinase